MANNQMINQSGLKVLLAKRPALVALGAGALSATGFAPLHLWPVMLAMMALLMQLLWLAPDRKAAGKIGYAFGLGQFSIALNWIAHAFTFQDSMPHWLGYPAVVLLSVYLALFPAVAGMIAWTLGRGRPRLFALFLACAWMLTEYLRGSLFTGFAWNPLGVIWLGTGVDQLGTAIGSYGLSLLAVLASGALWWLAHRQWRQALVVICGFALLAGIGQWRAYRVAEDVAPVANARVIQPNINQNEKYDPLLEILNFRRLAELSSSPKSGATLIFWPEAAVPAVLDLEPRWRGRIAALLRPDDLLLLGGDKYHFREENGRIDTSELAGANNSLWVLDARGDLRGRYDKAHLVPFGEYLPMRTVLEAVGLSRLVPGSVDFWPGPGPATLDLPAAPGRRALRMGVQICYEIVFSGHVIDRANRPDFIFNPSNDAWFGSWGPPQHLAQARLRAIEEGVPVVRSTPTGVSAIVDPAGRIIGIVPAGETGALDAPLPGAVAPTLFARGGNIIPLGLALLLLVSGVAIGRRNR